MEFNSHRVVGYSKLATDARLMLFASVIAMLSTSEFARIRATATFSDGVFGKVLEKTILYYVLHGAEIALFLLACAVALSAHRLKLIPRSTRLMLALLVLSAALMTGRGLTVGEIFSQKVVAPAGPLIGLLSVGMVPGIPLVNWRRFPWFLTAITVFSTAGMWLEVLRTGAAVREDFAAAATYTWASLFSGVWLMFNGGSARSQMVSGWISVLSVALIGIMSATRLPVVLCTLVFMTWLYCGVKRRTLSLRTAVTTSACFLVVAAMLVISSLGSKVRDGSEDLFSGLMSRSDEDTRSGQIVHFFEDVGWQELVLGRGALATWSWPGMSPEWPGGTDIGYLSVTFYGGLPLLLAYLAIHVRCAYRVISAGPLSQNYHHAVVVALWCVVMCQSALPVMDVGYLVVVWCTGKCAEKSQMPERVPSRGWKKHNENSLVY